MKILPLLFAFLLAALTCCPARATGDLSEIQPGDRDQSGPVFDIRSEELATGEIQFHITAPDKKSRSGKSPTIALSIVKIIRNPDGFPTSQSVGSVRPLEAWHANNTTSPVFIGDGVRSLENWVLAIWHTGQSWFGCDGRLSSFPQSEALSGR